MGPGLVASGWSNRRLAPKEGRTWATRHWALSLSELRVVPIHPDSRVTPRVSLNVAKVINYCCIYALIAFSPCFGTVVAFLTCIAAFLTTAGNVGDSKIQRTRRRNLCRRTNLS